MRMQLASRASKRSSQSIALLHKQLKAKKGQGTVLECTPYGSRRRGKGSRTASDRAGTREAVGLSVACGLALVFFGRGPWWRWRQVLRGAHQGMC